VTNNSGNLNYTFTENGSFTFDYQGATGEERTETSRVVTEGTAIGMLPVPEKIGHTFFGWHTGQNKTGITRTADTVVIDNITLYAGWTLKDVSGAAHSFHDVDRSKWYITHIDFVVANALFDGVTKTEFKPDSKMTRAMFVTVLGRLAEQMGEETTRYTSSFTDVAADRWYTKYVNWAHAKGLVGATMKPSLAQTKKSPGRTWWCCSSGLQTTWRWMCQRKRIPYSQTRRTSAVTCETR